MYAYTPNLIRSKLHLLLSNILESKGIPFQADEPLRRQLDSLDLIVLCSEVECAFDLDLDQIDLDDANFRSIDTLAQLVARKQGASGSG